eukprot:tig00021221_g19350.t1
MGAGYALVVPWQRFLALRETRARRRQRRRAARALLGLHALRRHPGYGGGFCALCFEFDSDRSAAAAGAEGPGLSTLPCGHQFHPRCLAEGGAGYRCPVCGAWNLEQGRPLEERNLRRKYKARARRADDEYVAASLARIQKRNRLAVGPRTVDSFWSANKGGYYVYDPWDTFLLDGERPAPAAMASDSYDASDWNGYEGSSSSSYGAYEWGGFDGGSSDGGGGGGDGD